MRPILAAALLIGTVALPQAAGAQPNPNSQQIIEALRPNPLGGTRGIRPVTPSAPPSDSAAPAAAPVMPGMPMPQQQPPIIQAAPPAMAAPQPVASAPSINLTVTFGTGSAELTPQAVRTLDELGRALASSDLSAYRFRVEGHTDTVGNADANQRLSERRAATVVRFLMSKYAIAPSRLESVGMGEIAPLVPTGDQVPEPQNRRVQVINLGG